MTKKHLFQRLTFLFVVGGLVAVTADYACLQDVCADLTTAEFRTMGDIQGNRVERFSEAMARSGLELNVEQKAELKARGHLYGVVKLVRPVKHNDGSIETPAGWLPELPEGHPWAKPLTPSDDAFYSWFEERVVRAKLFDPENAAHVKMAEAYLAKSSSRSPEFTGWTYASRTECKKKPPSRELPDAF